VSQILLILPVLNSKEGRKFSEFHLGTLRFLAESGEVHFDIPDRQKDRAVRAHFARTFGVRYFSGSGDQILSHRRAVLEPGTAEHFEEAVRRLLDLGLVAVFEPE
jgi:hypothetical protein